MAGGRSTAVTSGSSASADARILVHVVFRVIRDFELEAPPGFEPGMEVLQIS